MKNSIKLQPKDEAVFILHCSTLPNMVTCHTDRLKLWMWPILLLCTYSCHTIFHVNSWFDFIVGDTCSQFYIIWRRIIHLLLSRTACLMTLHSIRLWATLLNRSDLLSDFRATRELNCKLKLEIYLRRRVSLCSLHGDISSKYFDIALTRVLFHSHRWHAHLKGKLRQPLRGIREWASWKYLS